MKLQTLFTSKIEMLKSRNEEGADIVQTILIIAMFVVVCVIVGTLVMGAITEQAEGVSECITGSHQLNTDGCANYSG